MSSPRTLKWHETNGTIYRLKQITERIGSLWTSSIPLLFSSSVTSVEVVKKSTSMRCRSAKTTLC